MGKSISSIVHLGSEASERVRLHRVREGSILATSELVVYADDYSHDNIQLSRQGFD